MSWNPQGLSRPVMELIYFISFYGFEFIVTLNNIKLKLN